MKNIADVELKWKTYRELHINTHKKNCAGLAHDFFSFKGSLVKARDFIFSREALKVIIVRMFFVHKS